MWQKLRDWGNTNPTQRAVAGFIPAVGQVLDAADIMDPEADMRTRLGHVATAMPWGKIGRVINVLRKGKKAAVPMGAATLGTAAAAKYWDDEDE